MFDSLTNLCSNLFVVVIVASFFPHIFSDLSFFTSELKPSELVTKDIYIKPTFLVNIKPDICKQTMCQLLIKENNMNY